MLCCAVLVQILPTAPVCLCAVAPKGAFRVGIQSANFLSASTVLHCADCGTLHFFALLRCAVLRCAVLRFAVPCCAALPQALQTVHVRLCAAVPTAAS
jgi:hypothetical protein